MKILLKRTGGFTAIPLTVALDTDQLGPAEKEALEKMVEAAHFSSLPENIPSTGSGADRFSYQVFIEEAGVRRMVQVSESGMPEALGVLIQRLTSLGRSQPKP